MCWMTLVAASTLWAAHTDIIYDPLKASTAAHTQTIHLSVKDNARQREIPLLIYLPTTTGASPVVLFSHGLGGSRRGCSYLGKHWSARGYVAVFLQHPGSDDSVWKGHPPARAMQAMKEAASAKNFVLRVQDVSVVLDQLSRWNELEQHALSNRLDLSSIGMSGHSFGAVTTQAVSGQAIPLAGQTLTDTRIKAALMLSPSSPRRGDPAKAFAQVEIPWLMMTGTKDTAPIGGQTVESRLAVFPNLPSTVAKYELVLHNAEHSAFAEGRLPTDRERRNPNHHRLILAISTAFWDTHLRGNSAASDWLRGAGVRSMIEKQDRWQYHVSSKDKIDGD